MGTVVAGASSFVSRAVSTYERRAPGRQATILFQRAAVRRVLVYPGASYLDFYSYREQSAELGDGPGRSTRSTQAADPWGALLTGRCGGHRKTPHLAGGRRPHTASRRESSRPLQRWIVSGVYKKGSDGCDQVVSTLNELSSTTFLSRSTQSSAPPRVAGVATPLRCVAQQRRVIVIAIRIHIRLFSCPLHPHSAVHRADLIPSRSGAARVACPCRC